MSDKSVACACKLEDLRTVGPGPHVGPCLAHLLRARMIFREKGLRSINSRAVLHIRPLLAKSSHADLPHLYNENNPMLRLSTGVITVYLDPNANTAQRTQFFADAPQSVNTTLGEDHQIGSNGMDSRAVCRLDDDHKPFESYRRRHRTAMERLKDQVEFK